MRHLKRGRKLNRTPTHKRAMVRNLVTSLFVHGRVVTTPAKAKEARPFAEKLITLAKDGGLHARRRAISLLHDSHVVGSLFDEIGPRYMERNGGYCRILHLEKTRVGDRAAQVMFELVEGGAPASSGATTAPASAAETPASTEPAKTEEKASAETGTKEDAETSKDEAAAEETGTEESASGESADGKQSEDNAADENKSGE